jgi:hypothetical protein
MDPSLASLLILYPVKKILHKNGRVTRLYDDINSGQSWWDIQVSCVLTSSFYSHTLERINCLIFLTFLIVSCHFISGWIKVKFQAQSQCIQSCFDLDFSHKRYGMAQVMEVEHLLVICQRLATLLELLDTSWNCPGCGSK